MFAVVFCRIARSTLQIQLADLRIRIGFPLSMTTSFVVSEILRASNDWNLGASLGLVEVDRIQPWLLASSVPSPLRKLMRELLLAATKVTIGTISRMVSVQEVAMICR